MDGFLSLLHSVDLSRLFRSMTTCTVYEYRTQKRNVRSCCAVAHHRPQVFWLTSCTLVVSHSAASPVSARYTTHMEFNCSKFRTYTYDVKYSSVFYNGAENKLLTDASRRGCVEYWMKLIAKQRSLRGLGILERELTCSYRVSPVQTYFGNFKLVFTCSRILYTGIRIIKYRRR